GQGVFLDRRKGRQRMRGGSAKDAENMAWKDHYASEFLRHQEHARRQPPWLGLVRKVALERFSALGFPTLDDEEWKYTNMTPIARSAYRLGSESKPTGVSVEHLQRITFGEMECSHVVFLNGRYAPELSRIRKLPEGTRVGSLGAAL